MSRVIICATYISQLGVTGGFMCIYQFLVFQASSRRDHGFPIAEPKFMTIGRRTDNGLGAIKCSDSDCTQIQFLFQREEIDTVIVGEHPVMNREPA